MLLSWKQNRIGFLFFLLWISLLINLYTFHCVGKEMSFPIWKKWDFPLSSNLINQCYLHLHSTLKTSTASNSTNESLEVTVIKSHFFSVEKLNNGLRIRGIRSTNTVSLGTLQMRCLLPHSRKCEPGLRDYQIVLVSNSTSRSPHLFSEKSFQSCETSDNQWEIRSKKLLMALKLTLKHTKKKKRHSRDPQCR